MARRSQLFTMMPWGGGINDSADPGAIPASDLTIADNILYTTAGARIKRPGLEYFDQLDIPAITSIELTSNVVTVTFESDINDGTNNKFVPGENISLVCSSDDTFNYSGPISTASGAVITYPLLNADILPIASPEVTIARTSSSVGIHDFWFYNVDNNIKEQLILMVTSQGKVFKFTQAGARTEVTKVITPLTDSATLGVKALASDNIFHLTDHGFETGTAIAFTELTGGDPLIENTTYYVERINANTFYLSNTQGGSRIDITTDVTSASIAAPFAINLPLTTCDLRSFNEKLFIASDGVNNWPIMYDPVEDANTYTLIKNAAPNASMFGEHEGRLIANDKRNPDYIYYSATGDHTLWSGYGDSGTIEIGAGDGDPVGITAIFPSFKGALFISKSEKLYRLPDPGLDMSRIELVSSGIGAISHKGCASVDMDDVLFVSKRGIHSLAATNNYGDFSGAFLSEKIQTTFSNLAESRKALTSGKYFSQYNSVAFAVSEDSLDKQDTMLLYNVKFKEWYRWPSVNLQAITNIKTEVGEKALFSTTDGRLVALARGVYYDQIAEAGEYSFKIKSGKIYVDGDPNSVKAFKKLSIIFRPQGAFQITANVKVDNHQRQSISFDKATSGDLLGSTFILGVSTLSYTSSLDTFTMPIDGVGRGIEIEIINDSPNQQAVIYGFSIEYVPAGISQETYLAGSTTE